MKVASVIGRSFEAPIVPGAYPELGTLDDVLGHLETLRTADLVQLDRVADLAYLFKHVVTQEVAYESMPFAVRSMLHGRVGAYIEAREPDAIERHLDLLAHHYWLGDDEAKKVEYLGRAAAAAQASFAERRGHRVLRAARAAAPAGGSDRHRSSGGRRSSRSSASWDGPSRRCARRASSHSRRATLRTSPGATPRLPRRPSARAASTRRRRRWRRRSPASASSARSSASGTCSTWPASSHSSAVTTRPRASATARPAPCANGSVTRRARRRPRATSQSSPSSTATTQGPWS